ncbi:hypothetical protein LT493_17955 [Streptomyces tricolor]|nr:hypothetical protein [Streptomyces tricolor]
MSAGVMPRLAAAVTALPHPAELLVAESYPGAPAHSVLLRTPRRPPGHCAQRRPPGRPVRGGRGCTGRRGAGGATGGRREGAQGAGR